MTLPTPVSHHHASDLPVVDLPARLLGRDREALVGADERHLAAVAAGLAHQRDELTRRLSILRRSTGGGGRQALDRDLEIHRLTGRLRMLGRFGLDVCLGRTEAADGTLGYVGRIGLTDPDGGRLLVDWRAPAARPFFAATHADPAGLASRRRYRWTGGRVTDFWDEVFADVDPVTAAGYAPDEDSTFITGLADARTDRMRDVLATLQADQDAAVRAGSHGALVVDGGPGTGKTVVALHRAAYLLHADPRLNGRRGGVLFVGPHRPYLAYVADVLPGLGEDGVQLCTLRDLVAEGADAPEEADPEVARLKASAALVAAVEPAVALYEEPPRSGVLAESEVADVWVAPSDFAAAFAAPDPGTPHNEAREQVWAALLAGLVDDDDPFDEEVEVPASELRAALRHSPALVEAVHRAWTLVEPTDLVGDLWSVPAYLRRCAPWLSPDEVRRLQREQPQAWTVADLPLLDAAQARLGDVDAGRRRRRRAAAEAAERAAMDRVVDDLMAADDDGEGLVTMLRQPRIREMLVDDAALPTRTPDALAGPFAHVVVDEAQELTDAEWQMLLRRCPSRSFTVVGDRAQARRGFAESWEERLRRVGFDDVTRTVLTVNYRTPAEVMAAAEPVIRAVLPDAEVPSSVRSSGLPVRYDATAELSGLVDGWLADHPDGLGCVIGAPEFRATERVRSLTPRLAKGLEFDLVVLVDPQRWGDAVAGAVDRYVAMTRATQQLVVLTSPQ